MQCPHCHATLLGNPVTCPQCRQKIRSLTKSSLTSTNVTPLPRLSTPPPANARFNHVTPQPSDARSRQAHPLQQAYRQQMPYVTPGGAPQNSQTAPKKKVGLILGLIGLVGWILPIIGIPLSITGLVFASKEKHTPAIILNSIVLVVSIINAIAGAVQAVS